jgi:hypothetical protein
MANVYFLCILHFVMRLSSVPELLALLSSPWATFVHVGRPPPDLKRGSTLLKGGGDLDTAG